MGIQSTKTINRETVIDRILQINQIVKDQNYLELEATTSECKEEGTVQWFIDNAGPDLKTRGILEKYTNSMLEDIMDIPFVRYSMFDNYIVES